MRLIGITLMWVGGLLLLKNIGMLRVIDASIIWPVVIIILGTTMRKGCHGGMKGMCGMGMMGKWHGNKCEHGQDIKNCSECKM
jgi:hypothetical protein